LNTSFFVIVILGAAAIAGLFLLITAIAFAAYGKLWFRAYMSSADLSMLSLIGMGFRQVNSQMIVQAKIMASQAGLDINRDSGISTRPGDMSSRAQTDRATGKNSASAPMLFMKTEVTAAIAQRIARTAVSLVVPATMRRAKLSTTRDCESAETISPGPSVPTPAPSTSTEMAGFSLITASSSFKVSPWRMWSSGNLPIWRWTSPATFVSSTSTQ
jgi:hypothetical protein